MWVCRCQYAHPLSCSQGTHRVVVSHVLDLFVVISPSQLGQALWVEPPTVWKELCTILFRQFCAKGVDGDDEGAAVCFKLWGQYTCKERGRGGRQGPVSWQDIPQACLPPETSQQEGGQALTSRMGHMASAVVPPSRVQNL